MDSATGVKHQMTSVTIGEQLSITVYLLFCEHQTLRVLKASQKVRIVNTSGTSLYDIMIIAIIIAKVRTQIVNTFQVYNLTQLQRFSLAKHCINTVITLYKTKNVTIIL